MPPTEPSQHSFLIWSLTILLISLGIVVSCAAVVLLCGLMAQLFRRASGF